MLLELLFRLFLGDAISLLDFADELITLSGHDVQHANWWVNSLSHFFLTTTSFQFFPRLIHLNKLIVSSFWYLVVMFVVGVSLPTRLLLSLHLVEQVD